VIAYAAINDVQDTLNHEHGRMRGIFRREKLLIMAVRARDMVTEVEHAACGPIKLVNTPVKWSESKPGVRMAPPTLGQHTDEILSDVLGMDSGKIEELRGEGVIG